MVLKSFPRSSDSVGTMYMGSSADIVKDHSTLKLLTHMNDLTFDKNPESIARVCLAFMYAVDGFLYEVQMSKGKNAKCIFWINGKKFEIVIEGLKGVEGRSEGEKIELEKEHIIIDKNKVENKKERGDGKEDNNNNSEKGNEEESKKDNDVIVIDTSPRPTSHVSTTQTWKQPGLVRSSSKLGARIKSTQGLSQVTSKSLSVKRASGITNTSLASPTIEFIPDDKWTSEQDKFIVEAVRDGTLIRELTKRFNERFGTALGSKPIRRRFSAIADFVEPKRFRSSRSPPTPDSKLKASKRSSPRSDNANLKHKSKSISPVTSACASDCDFDPAILSESPSAKNTLKISKVVMTYPTSVSLRDHKTLPQRSARQNNLISGTSAISAPSPMQTNKNDQHAKLKHKWPPSKPESDDETDRSLVAMNEISSRLQKRDRKSTGSAPLKPSELNIKKIDDKKTGKLPEWLFTPNTRPPVVTLINDDIEIEQLKEKERDVGKRSNLGNTNPFKRDLYQCGDSKNEENRKDKRVKIVETQSEKQIAMGLAVSRRIFINEQTAEELNEKEKNAKNSDKIDESLVLINTDGITEKRSLSNSAKPVKKRLNIKIDEIKKTEEGKVLKKENDIDDGMKDDLQQNALSETQESISPSIDIYSSNSANTMASSGGVTNLNTYRDSCLKITWGSGTGNVNGFDPRKSFYEQTPSPSVSTFKSMASIPSSQEDTPLGWTWASDFTDASLKTGSDNGGQHKD